MMGPGLYGAWQRGEADFSRLSHAYHDDVYGTMRRQATLKELGVQRVSSTRGDVSARDASADESE